MIEAVGRVVTFRVGDELYAADVVAVERVLRLTPVRALPQLPAWIEGVIEHEGRIVPVIDLRDRLAKEGARETSPQTRLLLVGVGDERCAAIVDQVLDVRPCDFAALAPAPAMLRARAQGQCIRGVFTRDSQLVVVIDLIALLTADERTDLQLAAAP